YDYAYMFKYSERPGTLAARKYPDDIAEEVKTRRLTEIIDLQNRLSLISNRNHVGKVHRVLAEAVSKRSDMHLSGRNSENKVIVFPSGDVQPGQYVDVKVNDCTSATLIGEAVTL
ncbi:MAG: TRAM domain-containing protein, partial [Flavobacteriales bacterium]